jgi:starvation-inducible DNA-binding protein
MTKPAAQEISKENASDNPVVQHLQRQTANAFILYANYKHYHWQTFGPAFRDLHLMFDEFAAAVLETLDELAERTRMIGQDPIFSPLEVQDSACVRIARAQNSIREMVEEADQNLMEVIADMRKAAKVADESNDPGSVDLFSKAVQVHEKHEWFLREILKQGDGFQSTLGLVKRGASK